MLKKLHHVAYRCADAEETVDFYTNVLGLKFAKAIVQDRVPSLQEYSPHTHIFFEMEDGSFIAFFELLGEPPARPDPNTPGWVQHLALEVEDMDTLHRAKDSLEAHGCDVVGPTDHGFCQSIYFHDPSGHRLEITVRTEKPDEMEQSARNAWKVLAAWKERKSAHQVENAAAD